MEWKRLRWFNAKFEVTGASSESSGRVVAWTSGRCDASACGRVSRVSESMESSESEWRNGTEKVRPLREKRDESMESSESEWRDGTDNVRPCDGVMV